MLRSNFESEHLPIESLYSDPERLGIPGAPPSGLPPPDCPPGPPDDGDAEEDGDGGGGSGDIGAAGSTSGAALDYNQKETWVEVCKKMKETRIVPDRSGFKSKFSVSCKFLPMVKRSYPDAPFVIDEFGRVVIPAGFATASWKDPAYEAMKFVFGFETFDDNRSAKNEYGKSLGLCIPNFMPMDGAPPPSQTAMVPANPSSSAAKRQRTGEPSLAAASSTALAIPEDRLILPKDASLSEEQVDNLSGLPGVDNNTIVAIAHFPAAEATSMYDLLRSEPARNRKRLATKFENTYLDLKAKGILGKATALADHFRKKEIKEAILQAEEAHEEEVAAQEEEEQMERERLEQAKAARFLLTNPPPHEWTKDRVEALVQLYSTPAVSRKADEPIVECVPVLHTVTAACYFNDAQRPIAFKCILIHPKLNSEMHVWIHASYRLQTAYPDAYEQAKSDYREGTIERVHAVDHRSAPWMHETPKTRLPSLLVQNPAKGRNSFETLLLKSEATMDEYKKALDSDDKEPYQRACDESQRLMLSSTRHIPLQALQLSYKHFCEASNLIAIDLNASFLRECDISVWWDPVGMKEMCTGFAKASVLKSLADCLCLPNILCRTGGIVFDDYLLLCERAMELIGTSRIVEALADSEHMQFSASSFVKLDVLKDAFVAYCDKRDLTPDELTREFLATRKMTLMQHQGTDVVTGLEHFPVVDTTA